MYLPLAITTGRCYLIYIYSLIRTPLFQGYFKLLKVYIRKVYISCCECFTLYLEHTKICDRLREKDPLVQVTKLRFLFFINLCVKWALFL